MKQHFASLLALSIAAVSACTPSSAPTYAPGRSPTPLGASSPPSLTSLATSTPLPSASPTIALPLMIQPQPNASLAVSAVISSTGGTLSAQAPDGTQFQLTFPKDALLDDTKITLTPLARLDGLPFSGGFPGAVQLAPEGLRLLQPATLTITSPRLTPASGFQTIAFVYHASGERLYLTPFDTQSQSLSIPIWHFSGSGAAQGTSSEIQSQFQRVPSDPEDAMNQRMAEYLIGERQHQLRGEPGDPDMSAKIIAYQREYFLKFIQPKLALIRQDCEASKSLLPQALGWLRAVQLWGLADQFQSESGQIYDAWDDGIVNCYNKEYDQCLIDKDIKHRSAMLNLLRLAEMGRSSKVLARLDQTKPWKCPRRSYRVDYGGGDAHFGGTICSLDKPFTLDATGPGGRYKYTFTPSSNAAGTYQAEGKLLGGAVFTDAGNYTIGGTDAAPLIQWTSGGGTLTVPGSPVGSVVTDFGTTEVPLEPLEPPCDN